MILPMGFRKINGHPRTKDIRLNCTIRELIACPKVEVVLAQTFDLLPESTSDGCFTISKHVICETEAG